MRLYFLEALLQERWAIQHFGKERGLAIMDYVLFGLLIVIIINFCIMFWANNENTKLIYRNLKKNREFDQVKQAQVENLAKETLKSNQLLVNNQIALDKKLDALSIWMDKRNTYVTFQQEQFISLAKSDMLAARRDELLRTKELKVALERLMGVALTSRQPASPNDILAIENLTNRIEELEDVLKEVR